MIDDSKVLAKTLSASRASRANPSCNATTALRQNSRVIRIETNLSFQSNTYRGGYRNPAIPQYRSTTGC